MNRMSTRPMSMKYRAMSNPDGGNRTNCPSIHFTTNESHVADSVSRQPRINLLRAITTNAVTTQTTTITARAMPPRVAEITYGHHAPERNIVIKPGTVPPRPETALARGTTSRKRRGRPRP